MPDIAMCRAVGCPKDLALGCYRAHALPDPLRQAYFIVSPYDPATGTCAFFEHNAPPQDLPQRAAAELARYKGGTQHDA